MLPTEPLRCRCGKVVDVQKYGSGDCTCGRSWRWYEGYFLVRPWVRVSENLPHPDHHVLWWNGHTQERFISNLEPHMLRGDKPVTHWMELPTTPPEDAMECEV